MKQVKSESIAYSDGPVEEQLLSLVTNARELNSDTDIKPEYYASWPIRYHLSSMRPNCIRHLNFAGLDVLEFGSGMGGVSRFLAENCQSLTVVEGTQSRFNVLKKRLHDLGNWEGTVCNYQDFQSTKKFDVVCFFGVLEYAGKYIGCDDPFAFAISHAKTFLRPGGVILVAIENKNGLKYFSGCTEDHYPRHFYGICGYPLWNEVKTFSKKEMVELFDRCGLHHTNTHYLCPDYKLTRAALTDKFVKEFPHLAGGIVSSYLSVDYSGKNKRLFPEILAWSSLTRSGLLEEMVNSYLFIASAEDSTTKQNLLMGRANDAGAYIYSQDRKHSVKSRIVREKDGLAVEKVFASPHAPQCVEGGGMKVKFNVPSKVPVYSGESFLHRFVNYHYYGTDQETITLLSDFFSYIFNIFKVEDDSFLRGDAIDAAVANCTIDSSQAFNVFDTEYSIEAGIRKSWFILRNCIILSGYVGYEGTASLFSSYRDVYTYFCELFGLPARFEEDMESESTFQRLVLHQPKEPELVISTEQVAAEQIFLTHPEQKRNSLWYGRIFASLLPQKKWRKKVRGYFKR